MGVLFLAILSLLVWARTHDQSQASPDKTKGTTAQKKTDQTTASKHQSKADLPQVSPSDWELILVNREHVTPEFYPELVSVDSITVDKRIAQPVLAFLRVAQDIDPAFHLISGYRSVDYQKDLFQYYINQEKANNPSLSDKEAENLVKTYSQPGGASEHQTGLAIDMSTVDALNQADPDIMSEVQKIAPDYGFVLRFTKGKTAFTGVGYEDWHFRYVGKASARYMTDHDMTLEEYIKQLEEK